MDAKRISQPMVASYGSRASRLLMELSVCDVTSEGKLRAVRMKNKAAGEYDANGLASPDLEIG